MNKIDEKKLAEIEKSVIDIVGENLRIETKKIKPETKLGEELNINSVDAINIVLDIEEKFNIEIPEEDIKNFVDIKSIVEALSKIIALQPK